MEIARGTDLPDLLASLGYTVTRIGRYYSTKEMDSLRIKNRRTWYRYSERVGGDAITFLQHFCGRSFPEAVEDLLAFHGRARDAPAERSRQTEQAPEPPKPFALPPRHTDARRVYAYLKKRGIEHLPVVWSDELPKKGDPDAVGSVSFVPPVMGLLMAGFIVGELVNDLS